MHNGVIVGVLRQRATFASLRSGVRIPYAPPQSVQKRLFLGRFFVYNSRITSKKRKKRGIYPLFFRFLSLKNATRAPTPNRLMARRRL